MPEEMSIRCPLKVSGRREYMEDLPRDKNKRGEKKKTWNKKNKKSFMQRVLVKRSSVFFVGRIKSDLPGGGALRAIYKNQWRNILSK